MSEAPSERAAVLAATALELRAVRRRVRGCELIECGVSLSNVHGIPGVDIAITCGLSGGLRDDVPTGALVIPYAVYRANGEVRACDPAWTQRLRAAAAHLGYTVVDSPLLTSERLVTGNERARWAKEGFAAVDMETALLPLERIAAVRVILDTPKNELSPEWIDPARALRNPRNWPQAWWLARNAARCADIAARVVGAAVAP